jgi:spheroidene monooxygenase
MRHAEHVAEPPEPLQRVALPTANAALARESGAQPPPGSAAVLVLVQYRAGALAWGLSRLVLGPRQLGAPTGLRFARILGSGRDAGFGLAPSFERQGLLAFFDGLPSARSFLATSAAVSGRQARASDYLTALLTVSACRGSWGGHTLRAGAPIAAEQPVAALTRASIRPQHARTFWQHSPPSERSVGSAPGCQLAVGLGEAPLLRQATFSLWDSAQALSDFATQGAHHQAAQQAWQQKWFSEWMFVRFRPLAVEGRWRGRVYG